MKMGSKFNMSFSGIRKGTSLRETTSFDALSVKVSATAWGSQLEEPKKLTECNFAYVGTKFSNRIVMKFCIAVGNRDIINHADFSDHRFMRFRIAGGSNFRLFY